jgi:hypothetical protein
MQVVCSLKGGLGNQLFQWAAARRLAGSLGWKMRFDVKSYGSDTHGRTPLILRLLNEHDAADCHSRVNESTNRILTVVENQANLELLANIQPRTRITDDVGGIILDGYWQDSRLVSEEDVDEINKKLSKVQHLDDLNQWHDIKSSVRPVSVHLRRHDYGHHGVGLPNFYVTACSMLLTKYPDCRFFVFSDEPNFAKWLFMRHRIPVSLIEEQDPILALNLMAQCCIHIISNSTYSWWGARLAKSSKVFVPFPWSFIHRPSQYLIPKHWTVIDEVVQEGGSTPAPYSALERLRLAIA